MSIFDGIDFGTTEAVLDTQGVPLTEEVLREGLRKALALADAPPSSRPLIVSRKQRRDFLAWHLGGCRYVSLRFPFLSAFVGEFFQRGLK